jgi:hypothetical protein
MPMLMLHAARRIAEVLRMALLKVEQSAWPTHLLVEPACLALLAMPVSGPALAFVAEAISVARLLTVLEKLQLKGTARKRKASASNKQQPQHQQQQQPPPPAANTLDHSTRSGVSFGASTDVGGGLEAFPLSEDELDVDQRIKLRSRKAAQGRISAIRFSQYLLAAVAARLHLPGARWVVKATPRPPRGETSPRSQSSRGHSPRHHTIHVEHGDCNAPLSPRAVRAVPLLPVPLLQTRAVERLGTVTTLSMVDDELVCEDQLSPEEVFLLNSKEDHDALSTVLRLMHESDASGAGHHVRFEDPFWWKHVPSLKPLGFSCLNTGQPPPPANPHAEQVYDNQQQHHHHHRHHHHHHRHHHHQAHPAPAPQPQQRLSAEQALLRFVTAIPPQRSLERLGREIGFCDADLKPFKERFRVQVMAPHLVDAKVAEDTHALSLEETRMRGTLKPHITCVVMEDARNGGMQLMAAGNPALCLPLCYDYWDGRVITALGAEDRRSILDTYHQWTLEDFDVMALTYTPVPRGLSHRLSMAQRGPGLPIYMVDTYTEAQQHAHLTAIREQANRERQAQRERQALAHMAGYAAQPDPATAAAPEGQGQGQGQPEGEAGPPRQQQQEHEQDHEVAAENASVASPPPPAEEEEAAAVGGGGPGAGAGDGAQGVQRQEVAHKRVMSQSLEEASEGEGGGHRESGDASDASLVAPELLRMRHALRALSRSHSSSVLLGAADPDPLRCASPASLPDESVGVKRTASLDHAHGARPAGHHLPRSRSFQESEDEALWGLLHKQVGGWVSACEECETSTAMPRPALHDSSLKLLLGLSGHGGGERASAARDAGFRGGYDGSRRALRVLQPTQHATHQVARGEAGHRGEPGGATPWPLPPRWLRDACAISPLNVRRRTGTAPSRCARCTWTRWTSTACRGRASTGTGTSRRGCRMACRPSGTTCSAWITCRCWCRSSPTRPPAPSTTCLASSTTTASPSCAWAPPPAPPTHASSATRTWPCRWRACRACPSSRSCRPTRPRGSPCPTRPSTRT